MALTYGIPRVVQSRWLNHTHWICDRHVPSSQIPARMDSCWYFGCLSTRPPESERPADPEDPEALKVVEAVTPAVVEPEVTEEPMTEWERLRDEENRAIIAAALAEYAVTGPTTPTEEPEGRVRDSADQFEVNFNLYARSSTLDVEKILNILNSPEPSDQVGQIDQPSAQEKKRGATMRMSCSVCGAAVWRRPSEAHRKVYFCQDHRKGGRRSSP